MLLAGPQRHTMLVGGSRSGKTFWLVRAIVIRALRAAGSRHVILRFRNNAVEMAIGMDTFPTVMEKCFPAVPYKVSKQPWLFTLPNGAEVWLGGLDDKDRVEKILGTEFATIYLNECSQIPYASSVVALTRLAQNIPGLRQRAYYDLNPTGTGHWTHRLFLDKRNPDSDRPVASPDDYRWIYVNPLQNADNLTPEYLASLEDLPERQRKRFLEGVYTAEIDGALWTLETIEQSRCTPADMPALRRVVVSVDPSGTSGPEDKRSDEIGIVVAGLGLDGRAYVLADLTCKEPPAVWSRRVIAAWNEHDADAVVAEKNFGGEMVRHTVQVAARDNGLTVPVKLVTASRGKAVRAEPVSLLYQEGKVRHLDRFARLEDQMINMSTAGYQGHKSPDRVDALVWALSELMVKKPPAPPPPSPRAIPIFAR